MVLQRCCLRPKASTLNTNDHVDNDEHADTYTEKDRMMPMSSPQERDQIAHFAGWLLAEATVAGQIIRRRTTQSKILLLGLAIWLLSCSVYWMHSSQASIKSSIGILAKTHTQSPFTGAFASFPTISNLPSEQRRITVIGVWNDDNYQSYLRHFFHTIQLNADSIDLLMINRLITPGKECFDPAKHGLNISWSGNIQLECMTDKEWKERHANFVCSEEYGWACNSSQYAEVLQEFESRPDENNYNWRPLRGYVFRDLFADKQSPFWAWVDHDVFVGNFLKYPFNVLSQVSIMTGYQELPENIFMAGQLTAFNIADENLATAWKKFPAMKTPEHFTKNLAGAPMPRSSEERYWSYGYLRSTEDLPGSNLSWVMYPDMHGDDHFDGRWRKTGATHTNIISGRELLLVPAWLNREDMENIIMLERGTPADDLGGIGWTGGEDGSQQLIEHPELSADAAKALVAQSPPETHRHRGMVDSHEMFYNCSSKPNWRQCVPLHPKASSTPPLYRQSLVHLREQQPGQVFRRLEPDDRHRIYERKLIRHFLKAKREAWFDFPPFEITDDLVLKVNYDNVEVWKMGPERDKTLFFRRDGGKPIG